MSKAIILANGKPPKRSLINDLIKRGYSTVICADGGANTAFKLNIVPDYIIGDFDSITPEVFDFYKNKTKIIKIRSQNDTDVEKCLKFAIKKKYEEVILTGVTGNRLDHTFCNLGIMLKFKDQIDLKLIAEESILSVHSGKTFIPTYKGETISIYGFNDKTYFTSTGLKYKLDKTILPFGVRESTSNVASDDLVMLDIKGGDAFIMRNINEMKKNGLF